MIDYYLVIFQETSYIFMGGRSGHVQLKIIFCASVKDTGSGEESSGCVFKYGSEEKDDCSLKW